MALLKLNNLEMTYGKGDTMVHALRNINLEIEKGDLIAILGKSGCGKSTLLNILGAVSKPKQGSYFFEEIEVNKLNMHDAARFRNKNIGFVVQHFALIKELTVRENVGLPLVYQSCKKRDIERRVAEVLKLLEIDEKANRYPTELSGGQCQRAAIARAIITNPEVILADEPTGALDEENGKNILNIFKALNEKGTTIVLVTHDMEIADMCKRKICLRDGRII
ncbi:MAG: ABC transporter ATP-binding protein [Lachnospiraceae bacterium]|nr:ABC transporter ATP-binding protein [Lachnospiraceae bacterium]